MKQSPIFALLAIAQAYAWFVPYLVFQHAVMGAQEHHGSQDMGLMTIIPAWIWALAISIVVSFIAYYKTQRFPWINLLLVGVVSVPITVSSMFTGINLEIIDVIYRLGGLIPAGRRGWESFGVVAMTLILIAGFFSLKKSATT